LRGGALNAAGLLNLPGSFVSSGIPRMDEALLEQITLSGTSNWILRDNVLGLLI